MATAYKNETDRKNNIKLRSLCEKLPSFMKGYFDYLTCNPRTKVAYAYDLIFFCEYLVRSSPALNEVSDITPEYLDKLTLADLTDFQRYLSDDAENQECAVARKISSLRGLWKWMIGSELVVKNPTLLLKTQKIPTKNIITLNPSEVKEVMHNLETGEVYDKVCAKNREELENMRIEDRKDFKPSVKEGAKKRSGDLKINRRDEAIIALLLGTGLRVSELVGIDVNDVKFSDNSITVIRKGGGENYVFFNDYVAEKLQAYLRERKIPKDGSSALFVSAHYRRISVRSVELLVKKFVDPFAEEHITTHKLRSTYATDLYRNSRDIYLVSKALNHKDAAVTAKYADTGKEILKEAAERIDYFEKNE